jgi:hypothetical protein
MKKRNKSYKPKMVKIPMTKALYDEFGLQLHTAYAELISQPSTDAFDRVAAIMNVVTLTAINDARFKDEVMYLKTGISTMNQIINKCDKGLALRDHESAALGVAISAIDRVLPYMDISKLYQSMMELRVENVRTNSL